MDQLTNAMVACQKLEKKLRQLRNQGRASVEEVAAAQGVVAVLRKLCVGFGVQPIDLDTGAEKQRRRRQ